MRALAALIILLFSVNLASAEVTIGQYKYPTIILVPIISILVSVLILIALAVIVVGSKRKELANVLKSHVPKIQMPTRFFGKAKKPAKAAKELRLEGEEAEYIKEIHRFKHHLNDLPPEQAFGIISDLTKKFFKEMLRINYQCTYNELAEELRKRGKRKELIDVCNKFSEIKYSDEPISREGLKAFADEIERLLKTEHITAPAVSAAAKNQRGEVSRAFIEKRGNVIKKIFDVLRKPQKKTIEREEMLNLIKQESEALKRDMEIAQQTYHKILSSYYKLPKEERKEVYNKMIRFYQDVNKLLFSSFYSERSKKELENFADKLAKLKEEKKPLKAVKEIAKPREERKEVKEELERLASLEKEARERLKAFGESVIEKAIKPYAETEPQIKEQAKIEQPVPIWEEPAEAIHERIPKMPMHKAPVHKISVQKLQISKTYIDELKSPGHKRRIESLNKEAKELVERLEKLQKSYIG